MANAKKCDICGDYYDRSYCADNRIVFTYDTKDKYVPVTSIAYDCCPKCMMRIKHLIDGELKCGRKENENG